MEQMDVFRWKLQLLSLAMHQVDHQRHVPQHHHHQIDLQNQVLVHDDVRLHHQIWSHEQALRQNAVSRQSCDLSDLGDSSVSSSPEPWRTGSTSPPTSSSASDHVARDHPYRKRKRDPLTRYKSIIDVNSFDSEPEQTEPLDLSMSACTLSVSSSPSPPPPVHSSNDFTTRILLPSNKSLRIDDTPFSSPADQVAVSAKPAIPQSCVCRICGKAFSRPWLLQGHVRTHTGEKPFPCSICHKRFADKSNLRAHIQTHSGLKPHECPHCSKRFALRSYLSKHLDSNCKIRRNMSVKSEKSDTESIE